MDGWRSATTARWPRRCSACASPTEVVVLPSPSGVGVTAVTTTYLAVCVGAGSSRTARSILATPRPYGSRCSSRTPRSAATLAIGRRVAALAMSRSAGRGALMVRSNSRCRCRAPESPRPSREFGPTTPGRPRTGPQVGAHGGGALVRRHYADPMPQRPALDDLLHAAVSGVGGVERPGQVEMAKAVAHAIDGGEHLLVQAGTGTGKSLAYLVPADAHAPVLGRRPTYALVKGRRNYVCLNKLEGGFPDDEDGLLSVGQVDAAVGRLGQEVVRLREWANATDSGDRDELVPGVSERAWRQVSVSAHECLGGKCPLVAECFVERAREAAKDVDVVVTNHSFMAIDSFEGRQMLPEHDVLVVDEAHELVDRVTATITDELTGTMVMTAAKKAGRMSENTAALDEAGEMLAQALEPLEEGRMLGIPDSVGLALARVRDTARTVQSDLKPPPGQEVDGARQIARAAVDEVHENAERILEERELDVVWLNRGQRRGP